MNLLIIITLLIIVIMFMVSGYSLRIGERYSNEYYGNEYYENCDECLEDCKSIPELKDKSDEFSGSFCTLKCYNSCAINENDNCIDVCKKMLDSNSCDHLCSRGEGLGCKWGCKERGLGGVCSEDCDNI